MKIAIIGAGFAGLASCLYLLQEKKIESVTIFDAKGIGKGSSGIATGLLNPYMGPKAKLAWPGINGMQATLELIKLASEAIEQPVIIDRGVFRPALSDEQDLFFQSLARNNPDLIYWTKESCQKYIPSMHPYSGLFIPNAVSIDAPRYLQGLWLACQNLGAKLIIQPISNISEIEKDYDQVILSAGAGINAIEKNKELNLRLEFVKGQSLILEYPSNLIPFKHPLNGYKHLLMCADRKNCIIGATYEREFKTVDADLEKAKADLLGQETEKFFPQLCSSSIIACQAGIRVAGPDRHLPIVGRLDQKLWIYTALGSKGLLQHAFCAKLLCQAIINQNKHLIPLELSRWLHSN